MTEELDVNINWLAIPHQKLYDDIHNGPGVAGAHSAEATYRAMEAKFVAIRSRLEQGLRDLKISWEGIAASSAADRIEQFSPWAGHAGEASRSRSSSTTTQMGHYAQARNSMPKPEPVPPMPGGELIKSLAGFLTIPVDRHVHEAVAQQAHLRAAEVMETYSKSSAGTVGGFTAYNPPPEVSVDVPDAPVPAPRPPIGGGGSRPAPRFRGGSTDTSYTSEQSVNAVPVPDDHGGNLDLGGVEQQQAAPMPVTPPPVMGQGASPITAGGAVGTPGGFAGIPMAGNSFGGAGGLGSVGRSAGGASGVPVGGPNNKAMPAPRNAPAGKGAVARGASGKPGQSFMQSALGQAQREEDSEHTRKYSIIEDIVGELPLVAPAVIGEHTDDR
ncbi:PPE domain-containing protein [Allokutzneria oryzae]|uniref:PPE domain-containing protein n=1 Tax=Allokutzneria oryzae TaxID=1378989 RepID=A0ABV6A2A9_9PSEU